MLFKGTTVRLRKMSQKDKGDYHRWNNDMELAPLVNPFIDLQSEEEIDGYFQNQNDSSRKNYIIEHIEDEKSIGYVGLFNINHYHKNSECYIAVCEKSYHGKGVGFEAMKLLMEYVFRELNMHRLSLRVFAKNERAIRLYEKLGFKKEGFFRDTRFHDGQWQSSYVMAILQDEYRSIQTTQK